MPGYAIVLICAIIAAAAAPVPAGAQTPGMTQPGGTVQAVFDEIEKRIIREHFGKKADAGEDEKKKKQGKGHGKGKSGSMPPGLAKRGSLPPGLQRQLDKNGRLPPGLAKRELPADLHFKLKPAAPGTERAIIDDAVVLIERATGKVLDAIEGVVTGRKAR